MAAPKYLALVAGIITEVIASVTSAANALVATDATGHIDVSMLPTGVGPDTATVVASEALAAGNLVNIYNNAGTANCRKADGSASKPANGYVIAAVLSGGNATVYMSGINTAVTGLTPGDQFLSDTSPGAATVTPPAGAAHICQRVGVALSATSLQFEPDGNWVVLAS